MSTFSSSSVAGLGNEPKVIASAFAMDVNQRSAPVVGNNGVYVVQLSNKPAAPAPTNLPSARQRASNTMRNQISGLLMEVLKDNADIEDFRSKFY